MSSNAQTSAQTSAQRSTAQRYTFDQLRQQINEELLNKEMTNKLYKSTDGIFRIIDAIIKTHGEQWTAHIVNNQGQPLLTKEEEQKFEQAFRPYIDTIIDFFKEDNKVIGGTAPTATAPTVESLSGLSRDFIDTKLGRASGTQPSDPTKMFGVDDIYAKIIDRIGQIDQSVNTFASKYGILRLEKEHDLEKDPRIIPAPLIAGISSLLTPLGVPPNITTETLKQVRLPFRLIVFAIYLALDVARIGMAVSNQTTGRKILSIVLSIADFLKGDWKKAILSFIGYFGMTPLLTGEIIKIYLSLFRTLSPQLQENIIFGSLDATKSVMIGILLAIFQVTAPEEVRLPLIGVLEKVAQTKAKMDGVLESQGLSARSDYFSPTFHDLNNIQAVMSDEAYICSSEFDELIKAVNTSTIIKIVLQILRIPVTEEFKKLKCGEPPLKPFAEIAVDQSIKEKQKEEKASSPMETELPISLTADPVQSVQSAGKRSSRKPRRAPRI